MFTRNMTQLILVTYSLLMSLQLSAQTDTLRLMSYNLLNFPDGRDNCGTNIVVPDRWDSLAIITNYVQPDILMVCELQNETGADSILNRALNIGEQTAYQRATFVANQSAFPTNLNNMLFYNSEKLGIKEQNIILTNLRDISKYTLFYKDANLGIGGDTTFLEVYVGHLDAGRSDSLSRKQQADSLRKYLDTASVAKNFIFGGDFNFYKSSESGYQTLLSGNYPLIDPINRSGDWSANFSFADIHTQSTRAFGTTSLDCGGTGGVDDRFDFILASEPVMNGSQNISYISGSYQALANNGSTYNGSINDAGNTSVVPQAVKNALYYTSDHLPVIMDLEIQQAQALPLELLSFEGEALNELNQLHWILENSRQEQVDLQLQRSNDGVEFEIIQNWAIHQKQVQMKVEDLPAERLSYYRLAWSNEQQVQFSPVIAIENEKYGVHWQLFPNPTSTQLYIQFQQALTQEAKLVLYNAFGQKIQQWRIPAQQQYFQINSSLLPTGNYFLKIEQQSIQNIRKFYKK